MAIFPLTYIAGALWLALPAVLGGVLHMVIVKLDLLSRLAIPLDGGRLYGGRPLLGAHKTWRGVVVIVAATAALGTLQGALLGPWASTHAHPPLDYAALAGPLFTTARLRLAAGYTLANAVLGVGYVLGELPNSFFKRRLGIEPGEHAHGVVRGIGFVLDQSDSVTCALGLGWWLFSYSAQTVAFGVVVLSLVHALVVAALHGLRLKGAF